MESMELKVRSELYHLQPENSAWLGTRKWGIFLYICRSKEQPRETKKKEGVEEWEKKPL